MNGNPGPPRKEYLGDAVYVRVDAAGNVILSTEDGIHTTNEIYLEPEVLATFLDYLGVKGARP